MSVYVRHKLNGVGRGDWLAMRKEGIGGSDSSVILGLNPFTSEMELWMDKVGSMPEKPASEAVPASLAGFLLRLFRRGAERFVFAGKR